MASFADGGPCSSEKKNADQGLPRSWCDAVMRKIPFAASMAETVTAPVFDVVKPTKSVMTEWTVAFPPLVALRWNQVVVWLTRRADTRTAPSARMLANPTSAHEDGTDGKIAIGLVVQIQQSDVQWYSSCGHKIAPPEPPCRVQGPQKHESEKTKRTIAFLGLGGRGGGGVGGVTCCSTTA